MGFRLALTALWVSLVYLLAAAAVTGKFCFDQLRVFHQGAAKASGPLEFVSPAWVIQQADEALDRLWWMCTAVGIGLVLLAASAVWVSLAGRSSAEPYAAPDQR
jgi:hypothetical protein